MKVLYPRLILLFSFLFISGFGASAQTRFGIKGGLNLANLKYVPGNQVNGAFNAKPLTSFQLGIVADYPVTWWMSLQPGLMVTGKGARVKQNGIGGTSIHKIHPWYLEIPVNLLFKPAIGYAAQLYFGAGPYLSFGLGGKSSTNNNTAPAGSYFSNHKLKFGNGQNKDLRMTDLGANILAGLEFNSTLMLGVQYGFSLGNNAPQGNDQAPEVLKNRVFSISLTILFGQSRGRYYY